VKPLLNKKYYLPVDITPYVGYLFVILSLMTGSLKPVLIQMGLLNKSLSVFSLTVIVAILTALIVILLKKPDFQKKHIDLEVILAGVLLLLNGFFTIIAIKYSSVIMVAAIIATTPLIIGLHQSFIDKKTISVRFVIGFFIAFTGVLLVIRFSGVEQLFMNLTGVFFAFAAVLCSDIYRILLQKLTVKISSSIVSNYVLLVGGVVCFFLMLFNIDVVMAISPSGWIILIVISLCAMFANLFFVKAIKEIGAVYTSTIYITKPAVILFLAMIFLMEKASIIQVAGIFIMMCGVFITEAKTKCPQSRAE
jgi:drug/metabolite transporter (DMT)-like permease